MVKQSENVFEGKNTIIIKNPKIWPFPTRKAVWREIEKPLRPEQQSAKIRMQSADVEISLGSAFLTFFVYLKSKPDSNFF